MAMFKRLRQARKQLSPQRLGEVRVLDSGSPRVLELKRGAVEKAWFNFGGKVESIEVPDDGWRVVYPSIEKEPPCLLPPWGMQWRIRTG